MSTLLVINLAEAGQGVTRNTQNTLTRREEVYVQRSKESYTALRFLFGKKHSIDHNIHIQRDVEKVDIVTLFDPNDRAHYGLGTNRMRALQDCCNEADKIYLCSHGSHTDQDHVFASKTLGGAVEELCTAEQLGRFAAALLTETRRTYRLSLIVCYAARSSRTGDYQDPEFLKRTWVLKRSVGYKVFKEIVSAGRRVRVTAGVGQLVAEMNDDIHLKVQTEQGIELMEERDSLKTVPELLEDLRQISLLPAAQGVDKARISEIARLAPAVARGDAEVPEDLSEGENLFFIGYLAMARRMFLDGEAKISNQPKYGKIVYQYDGGDDIVITHRWSDTELYRGRLL